jgi:hypothetical protein
MQNWLADSSGSAPPKPDMDRRASLLKSLGSAIHSATTMQAAADGLAAEFEVVNGDLAAINGQLDAAALDAIADEFEIELNDLIALSVTAQSRIASVSAAVEFLRSEVRSTQVVGDMARASAIGRRLERMDSLPKPQWFPTPAQTQAAQPAWQAKFAELLK